MSELSFYRSLLLLLIAAGLWHALTGPRTNPPVPSITQNRPAPGNLQPSTAGTAARGACDEIAPLSRTSRLPPRDVNQAGSEAPMVREIMEIQRRLGGSQVGQILDEFQLPGGGTRERSGRYHEMAFRDALGQLHAGQALANPAIERLLAYSRQLQSRDEKLAAAYQRLAEGLSDLRAARTGRQPAASRQPPSLKSSLLR